MDIREKLELLFALKVTKEEAERYILSLESGEFVLPLGQAIIDTPCNVVYLSKNGCIDLLPYLDLSRSMEVWGASSGGVLLKKTHEADGDLLNAKKWLNNIRAKGHKLKLPSKETLNKARDEMLKFNETMNIFRQNGIMAENWKDGWYWTDDCKNELSSYAFSFEKNCEALFVNSITNAHVRGIIVENY